MKTIAVTSGKGGVGKTSLSANIGVALAGMGCRTTVFDADLALANVEIVLGVRPEYNLQHVIAGEQSLADIVDHGPGGVGFIAGGSGIPTLMRSGPKRLGTFFEQVSGLSKTTDVLLFDTSAGLDNRVLSFVKFADEVLLVTTPEPASVTDAYATIKTVFRHKPDAKINVVVNMAGGESDAKEIFDILERITHDFIRKPVGYAGFVRRDDVVGTCARQRTPYVLQKGASVAKDDTEKLAVWIAGSLYHRKAKAA